MENRNIVAPSDEVFIAQGGETVASVVAVNLARHPLAPGLYEWNRNTFSVNIKGGRCVGSIVEANQDDPLSQEKLDEQLLKVDRYRNERSVLDAESPGFDGAYQALQEKIFGFALRN